MQIYKISATSSTNTYIKEKLKHIRYMEDIVVVADNQTHGRGQMQNMWQSRQGQSLTFSVFKPNLALSTEDQFFISMAASLAVKKTVADKGLPNVTIKWPNDILSDNNKFCGILVENIIRNTTISGSIIGIGLNVNETSFDNLPRATSMKLQSGNTFLLDEILTILLDDLDFYFAFIKNGNFEELKNIYHSCLFRKDMVSCFEIAEGVIFNGIIRGITRPGTLIVEHDNNIQKEYDLKEIRMLY